MSRRLFLIHNPVAGSRTRRRLAKLLTVIRKQGHQILLRSTERPGHAEELAAEASTETADIVVAAGGDGTVSEVVNGLKAGHPPLAFLPLGTANVLAWETGGGQSSRRALSALDTGIVKPIYPGLIDGRRFVLMASAGIDSRVVEAAHGPLKRTFGKLGFVIAALKEIAAKQSEPIVADVDGVTVEADLIVVTRARRYGGPFVIAPQADLTSPGLWVVAPQRRGRLALLRYGMALVFGKLADLPDVTVVRADTVTFKSPVGHSIQVDGDSCGTIPATVTQDKSEFGFLYPPAG